MSHTLLSKIRVEQYLYRARKMCDAGFISYSTYLKIENNTLNIKKNTK